MASLILGLMGKKQSGKDTFAARLVEAHGFTRIGFADALKNVALDLDPEVVVEADETGVVYGPSELGRIGRSQYRRLSSLVADLGWDEAKRLREVRRLLQALGVAVRDNVDSEAWVQAAYRKARAVDGPVVITDVRFPNETEIVRRAGGRLARVYRPDLVSVDAHISENAVDHIAPDFYVVNDADVATLHAHADTVAHALRNA